MPVNKSQHFVPQHYLRQFRVGNSKQICVSRIEPFLAPVTASIRGQCQEDYFYRDDGQLDELLSQCECDLGPVLRDVAEKMCMTTEELIALRLLSVILNVRTRKSIEIHKLYPKQIFYEVIKDAIDRGKLPHPPEGTWNTSMVGVSGVAGQLVKNAMTTWLEMQTLECKLLKSPDGSNFVTSDHPVVLLNQYFQPLYPNRCFAGFSRSGFQLLLPMSPQVALFFYDPKIYKVGNSREKLVTLSSEDVDIINSLQVQSADRCLYFHDMSLARSVTALIKTYKGMRTAIEDCLSILPGKNKNEEIFHQRGTIIRLPKQWSFCKYKRHIKIGAENRRDPVWTQYIREVADSMHSNPEIGDVFDHMGEILGCDIKNKTSKF